MAGNKIFLVSDAVTLADKILRELISNFWYFECSRFDVELHTAGSARFVVAQRCSCEVWCMQVEYGKRLVAKESQ
eukprot:3645698-Amphidinium_carterae.1